MKKFKRIVFYIVLVLLMANVAVWVTGTTYIYKALVYQQPGIDDLDLFPYRTIENTGEKQAWKISENYNKFKLSDSLRNVLEKI